MLEFGRDFWYGTLMNTWESLNEREFRRSMQASIISVFHLKVKVFQWHMHIWLHRYTPYVYIELLMKSNMFYPALTEIMMVDLANL